MSIGGSARVSAHELMSADGPSPPALATTSVRKSVPWPGLNASVGGSPGRASHGLQEGAMGPLE
eukprot:947165-Alexandrium_andersonii.AAC.1